MAARAVATVAAAHPASEQEARLAALRLGAAQLAAAIQQAADGIADGSIEPEHPWPIALVERLTRNTARQLAIFVDPPGVSSLDGLNGRNQLGLALLADQRLAPMLMPAAAATFEAAAPSEPSGALAAIGDELEREARLRGALDNMAVVTEDPVVARRRRLRDIVFDPPRWPESRRRLQWRRQAVAAYRARVFGTLPPPVGKGRRRGAEGKRAKARRADLVATFQALTADARARIGSALRSGEARAFVEGHAGRHAVSMTTASGDWLRVRRQLGYLTRNAVPTAAAHERAAEFQRRLRPR